MVSITVPSLWGGLLRDGRIRESVERFHYYGHLLYRRWTISKRRILFATGFLFPPRKSGGRGGDGSASDTVVASAKRKSRCRDATERWLERNDLTRISSSYTHSPRAQWSRRVPRRDKFKLHRYCRSHEPFPCRVFLLVVGFPTEESDFHSQRDCPISSKASPYCRDFGQFFDRTLQRVR